MNKKKKIVKCNVIVFNVYIQKFYSCL